MKLTLNRHTATFFILLTTVIPRLTAENSPLQDSLSNFKDEVFKQDLNDTELLNEYAKVKALINPEVLSERDFLYYSCHLEYWMGRAYQSFDEVSIMLAHNDYVQREKYLDLRQFYSAKEPALNHYEVSLKQLKKYQKIEKDSESYRFFSELQGEIILLKPPTYALFNGLGAKGALDKALKLDPNNTKAQIMKANSDIYTPVKYGGNRERGIEGLKEVLKKPGLTEDETFDIYCGIGYGNILINNKEQAQIWLKKANEIYPNNIYQQGLNHLAGEMNG